MAGFQEKLLAQANPGNVTTSIYTVPALKTTVIKTIVISNTSSTDRSYRIFFNNAGNTFTVANALFYDIPIFANTTNAVQEFMVLDNSGVGSLGVSGSTTDVTFTVFGAEIG